jgi:hypothetical protein
LRKILAGQTVNDIGGRFGDKTEFRISATLWSDSFDDLPTKMVRYHVMEKIPMSEKSTSDRLAYESELRKVRAELAESHREFLDGEAKPLDVERLLTRVYARAKYTRVGDI